MTARSCKGRSNVAALAAELPRELCAQCLSMVSKKCCNWEEIQHLLPLFTIVAYAPLTSRDITFRIYQVSDDSLCCILCPLFWVIWRGCFLVTVMRHFTSAQALDGFLHILMPFAENGWKDKATCQVTTSHFPSKDSVAEPKPCSGPWRDPGPWQYLQPLLFTLIITRTMERKKKTDEENREKQGKDIFAKPSCWCLPKIREAWTTRVCKDFFFSCPQNLITKCCSFSF